MNADLALARLARSLTGQGPPITVDVMARHRRAYDIAIRALSRPPRSAKAIARAAAAAAELVDAARAAQRARPGP